MWQIDLCLQESDWCPYTHNENRIIVSLSSSFSPVAPGLVWRPESQICPRHRSLFVLTSPLCNGPGNSSSSASNYVPRRMPERETRGKVIKQEMTGGLALQKLTAWNRMAQEKAYSSMSP